MYRLAALLDDVPAFLFRRVTQITLDLFLCALATYLAFQLRFDGDVPTRYRAVMWAWIALLPLLRLAAFGVLGVYDMIWRYFSLSDATLVAAASLPATGVALLLRYAFQRRFWLAGIPASIIVIEYGTFLAMAAGLRVLRRLSADAGRRSGARPQRALLVGTPDSLAGTLRQVSVHPDVQVVGLVSPDRRARGLKIGGFTVMDEPSALPGLLASHHLDLVLIADASLDSIGAVVSTASEFGVDVRLLPSAANVVRGDVRVTALPKADAAVVDRALSQPTAHISVIEAFQERRVLITGAGGSIGAELCRQVAALPVASLILLDHDENSIFEIHGELSARAGTAPLQPIVGDIRNPALLRSLFEKHRPQVVLHAAAYKHVPVMEQNCCEAVLNNVVGTRELADAAIAFGAERFLMISTDKAVQPSSVMGASKRLAELLVQARGAGNGMVAGTRCACVRFGNVVGSRGSVVPIFLRQIAAGGPVTLTHEEMTRYFMTIPEAVQLVLQATTLGSRGDVYMLDMGDPMKIVDLARKLIGMSGLRPDRDIAIKIVGTRPGEKIHEQLWHDDSQVEETPFPRVLRMHVNAPREIDIAVADLETAARVRDDAAVRRLLLNMDLGWDSHSRAAASD